jgi:signal transduction histidine kinase
MIFILICSVQRLLAQGLPFSLSTPIDSVKNVQQATTNDTLRMVLANTIRNYYIFVNNNLDSAFSYSEQFLQLTQKLHYKIDEAYAYDGMGLSMSFLAHPQTLETLFKGIRIAEDPSSEKNILPNKYLKMMVYWAGDFKALLEKKHWQPKFFRTMTLASLYNDLGLAYLNTMYNQQKGFYYLYKAIDIYKAAPDSTDLGAAYHDIARYFASINQYDSCLYYAQKSHGFLVNKLNPFSAADMALIGTMYYKKGNVSKAITFLRKTIESNLKSGVDPGVSEYWLPYYTFAEYHLEMGNGDSSLYYAKKALEKVKTPADKQKASALLAKAYQAIRKPDSAARYFQLALSYNDIINNIDRKRLLQTQDFDEQLRQQELEKTKNRIKVYLLLGGITMLLLIAGMLLINNKRRKRINTLLQQKNHKIESTLDELKSTQAQLIQTEKMASLGELTAGIAHEIQNPLNFVNNFSDVNRELLVEMKNEMSKGNLADAAEIANDIISNEEKISHHGKRADSIVKGMLLHSRTSKGEKVPTNINTLADEYLRLSYQGLRAKGQTFNATIKTDFDASIGKISIIPQDIGRVLLNLYNNAFYAVDEKQKSADESYIPKVTVTTKRSSSLSSGEGRGEVTISVRDNGPGIPQSIVDKIFQPFFTTKPTGQGTGLGLSLSYDIIKAHGGELKVETKEGEGTQFTIILSES